ncbi:MAG: molybdopterin converting factor subunit 1 [Rhodothermia bacterium]|nr:MAG: molybdopterin converting factor subunit 1 [Rhodothermia bacterium]
MTLTVEYYAILKDVTGLSSESFEVPDGCTGSTLLVAVSERYPKHAGLVASVRIANSESYISNESTLEPDSTVLLIPPVSGG